MDNPSNIKIMTKKWTSNRGMVIKKLVPDVRNKSRHKVNNVFLFIPFFAEKELFDIKFIKIKEKQIIKKPLIRLPKVNGIEGYVVLLVKISKNPKLIQIMINEIIPGKIPLIPLSILSLVLSLGISAITSSQKVL